MTRSSSRSKARKRALDILFESELRDVDPITTLEERTAAADPPVREYTAELVRGVATHAGEIDERISASLPPAGPCRGSLGLIATPADRGLRNRLRRDA